MYYLEVAHPLPMITMCIWLLCSTNAWRKKEKSPQTSFPSFRWFHVSWHASINVLLAVHLTSVLERPCITRARKLTGLRGGSLHMESMCLVSLSKESTWTSRPTTSLRAEHCIWRRCTSISRQRRVSWVSDWWVVFPNLFSDMQVVHVFRYLDLLLQSPP
jgi:hypothetical protein